MFSEFFRILKSIFFKMFSISYQKQKKKNDFVRPGLKYWMGNSKPNFLGFIFLMQVSLGNKKSFGPFTKTFFHSSMIPAFETIL